MKTISTELLRCGRWDAQVLEDGRALLCCRHGGRSVLDLPQELGGRQVAGLGRYAFLCRDDLRCVRIPEGAEFIGEAAFARCRALQAVHIPPSVRQISKSAFRDCGAVTLCVAEGSSAHRFAIAQRLPFTHGDVPVQPDRVAGDFLWQRAAEGAILREYTGAAESLRIPDALEGLPVTAIGPDAFARCATLTSVILPGTLRELGSSAFHDCAALRAVTLPEGLTQLGSFAFAGCTALRDIHLPQGLAEVSAFAFAGCAELQRAELPAGLRRIGAAAFQGCSALKELSLPDGVEHIGRMAFSGSGLP